MAHSTGNYKAQQSPAENKGIWIKRKGFDRYMHSFKVNALTTCNHGIDCMYCLLQHSVAHVLRGIRECWESRGTLPTAWAVEGVWGGLQRKICLREILTEE